MDSAYFLDSQHLTLRDEVRRFAERKVRPRVPEDCRVPVENRIGDEGQGLDVAYSSSTLYGRPNLTAVALGIHQAIVEDTVAFCRKRELYGKPLAKLPTVALKLGAMQSRLMTARLAAYHAVHLLDRRRTCDAELMNAKLVNTEAALTSARVALKIFAGHGCQRDHNIERYLRDVIHTFPAAGTSDVQRLRLAQVALGEYVGAWSDRLSDLDHDLPEVARRRLKARPRAAA